MTELILVVGSLVISALGSVCVPICMRNAQNDVVEHVIIIEARPLHLEEVSFRDDLTDKDIDSSK